MKKHVSLVSLVLFASFVLSACGAGQVSGSTPTPTLIPPTLTVVPPTPTMIPITPTPVMIVPKFGKWSTGKIPIGDNGFLKIDFPVGLEDGKYSLYSGSYIYNIGGMIQGGTWGTLTETDIFSTSVDFAGQGTLTINGRFVSPTEAEGTISYTNLPTVEWTAAWQSE